MSKSNKEPNFPIGILVLCPSLKIQDLNTTLSWLKANVEPDLSNVTAIIPPTKDKSAQSAFESVCKTYRSKTDSLLSMVNKGMKYTQGDWNFIVLGGSRLKSDVFKRLVLFSKSETDILYPVSTGITNFVDAPLSWLYINKRGFDKVGDFSDTLSVEHGKILWAAEAIEAGCTFKGIAGLRIS